MRRILRLGLDKCDAQTRDPLVTEIRVADQDQNILLEAALQEWQRKELEAYAHEHGLSLEDALMRLALGQLDMRALGRRLGLADFSQPPH